MWELQVRDLKCADSDAMERSELEDCTSSSLVPCFGFWDRISHWLGTNSAASKPQGPSFSLPSSVIAGA